MTLDIEGQSSVTSFVVQTETIDGKTDTVITGAANEGTPNDASDIAINGAEARAVYGVTGAGIKVGIISDSFNAGGGYATDVQDGYLPGNVTVVSDLTAQQYAASGFDSKDEGRAMAELVHETAPGAQLYFATAGTTDTSFGDAITALQNAGVNIIVDDVHATYEPYFQIGGSIDDAVQAFLGAGGYYFTSAGNDGDTYYQSTFTPIQATLPGLGQVEANDFGGGNDLQSLTIPEGLPIDLEMQWNQPIAGPGGSAGPQNNLTMYLFQNGSIVAQSSLGETGYPEQGLTYFNTSGSTDFQLAIVWDQGATQPGLFRYIVDNTTDITINDPNAGQGDGDLSGHDLIPGVNVVGAADVTQAPPNEGPPVPEFFSEYGPGELLFDSNGNPLPNPVTTAGVSYVAPDGSVTSLSGFAPFYGTSAAGPVAAAVAALMLQKNPSLTPAQVTADLKASAIPMSTTDGQVGAGFIQANGALKLAATGPTAVPFLKDVGVAKNVPLTIASYTAPVALATGNPVTITAPSRGTLAASHGRVTYTSTKNPSLDQFSYELTDKHGVSSPVQTAIIGAGGTYAITGAASGYTSVVTGTGPSTITLSGSNNAVRFGHNKNTVTDATATGGNNTVIGSTGPTVVSLIGSGGGNTVALGSGTDTVTVDGWGNSITLGRGRDMVNGGTGDIIEFTGSTKLTLSGQYETVFIGPGGGTVSDHGTGTVIGVGPTATGLESIFHFSADTATGVLDLLGGVGGIATPQAAYAALTTDGKGGSVLPLGGGLSIDISGVTPAMLSAANFRIG